MRSLISKLTRKSIGGNSRPVSTNDKIAKIVGYDLIGENKDETWTKYAKQNEREKFEPLVQKAQEQIKDNKIFLLTISDGDGRTLFEKHLNVEKLSLSEGRFDLLLEDGAEKRESEITPQIVENNKKILSGLSKRGSVELPALGEDKFISITPATYSKKLSEKIATQKYIEEEIDIPGKMTGNMANINRQHLFMMTNLEFSLDLKNGVFEIENYQEAKEKFLKQFADFSATEKDFEQQAKSVVSNIFKKLSYPRKKGDEYIGAISSSDSEEEFKQRVSKLLEAGRGKVFKSKVSQGTALDDYDSKTHIVNSPFRHDDILNFGNEILKTNEYSREFGDSFLINSVVEEAAKIAHGEENFAKFFKQMNRNIDVASVAYPRDYSICRGGVFYQTDRRIAEAVSPDSIFTKKRGSNFVERLNSQKSDLELNGFNVEQNIPFDAKGGNMIFTKNDRGESVLLATVSDSYFGDDGVFKGGYVVENGELVERSDGVFSKVFGSNYPKFCKQIEQWGKSIGCDHVVVIERNLSEKYSFKDLYHLDLFCGDLPGGLLVINPEAVSQKNIEQLEGIFGKDKIIEISREEQNELCANFIVFNRTVVASSPQTPESFIEKMNQVGFDVYVPAIYLTKEQTMQQGWSAGVRCLTTSTSDNPKMIIDLDSVGKNNSLENTPKIVSGLSDIEAKQLASARTLGKVH